MTSLKNQSASKNTYIFDTESPTELARLINQDRIVTKVQGVVSGISQPHRLRTILDLGCGPGGWCLDCAFLLPLAEVKGVDISQSMVDYANARARTQRLKNASFGVMDITRPFEFPHASCDLVNARFLAAVLKREAWEPFLTECTRVLRPGGYLRLTEGADFGLTSSEAVNTLMDLTRAALYQLGYGFVADQDLGLLPAFLSFFKREEYQHLTILSHPLNYSAKTEAWADTYHNIDIIAQHMLPVLLDLELLSESMFTFLYQQAMIDVQMDTFCGLGHVTTIVGQKPPVGVVLQKNLSSSKRGIL